MEFTTRERVGGDHQRDHSGVNKRLVVPVGARAGPGKDRPGQAQILPEYFMLRNNDSGPEIELLGRISAGF